MAHSKLRSNLSLPQSQSWSMIPDFLAPSLVYNRPSGLPAARTFSTTLVHHYPRRRNPNRGVSALHRTGLREPLSVSKYPLPKPVLDPRKRSKVEADPNHGLWGFFNDDKSPLPTPEEDFAHGRAWTVDELRTKSWDDLHSLWWMCCKERNRIATYKQERTRLNYATGEYENEQRDKVVRRTQQSIKHALTERWYLWQDAYKLAMNDEEVDLSGEGPGYTPKDEQPMRDERSANGSAANV